MKYNLSSILNYGKFDNISVKSAIDENYHMMQAVIEKNSRSYNEEVLNYLYFGTPVYHLLPGNTSVCKRWINRENT